MPMLGDKNPSEARRLRVVDCNPCRSLLSDASAQSRAADGTTVKGSSWTATALQPMRVGWNTQTYE